MSRPTQDTLNNYNNYMYGTFTLSGVTFQMPSISYCNHTAESCYPVDAKTSTVWAVPLSIATTQGITIVFYSSGY